MKFIHVADIHLGAVPDKGFSWSREREQEIWDTFRRLIEKTANEQADLLLIAGDLFHRQPLKGELKEVNYLFSTIPETQVVLMAGNHDYIKKDSYYRDFKWNDNVTFFSGQELECVYFAHIQTYVYGLSYENREIRDALYDEIHPGGEEGIHILLAHGGDEKHVPMNFTKLAKSGFDYVALGHIHKPQVLTENKVVYAGALEPLDRNDTEEHGYIQGECRNRVIRADFCPFSSRIYRIIEVRTDREMTQSGVEKVIEEAIEVSGKKNIYSVILVGTREEDFHYNTERIRRLGNIVEIEDYTEPAIDVEQLYLQYEGTVIGAYIEQFPQNPQGAQLKALHYGIQALLRTKR